MELYEIPGNPMPPDAIVSAVRTQDGLTLRVARWPARHARGTIAIAPGRSEFIEHYYEIVAALLARDFDVVVWDWRGQGRSDREIGPRRRGHVSRFRGYRRDLAAIEAQVLRPFAPRPWYGFGHSMGAALLIDQAHDGASPFRRLVLSAPMIGLPLRMPGTVRGFAAVASALGFGRLLVPGGSETSPMLRAFAGNLLTGDRRQYERIADTLRAMSDLAVGSPTIRWLHEAFRLMRRFEDPFYAVETTVPILILAAGADRIVDTAATERFALALKAGRCITLPDARHQVIMESPAIVAQFWAAFDAFVPGGGDTRPVPEPVAAPAPVPPPLAPARLPRAAWPFAGGMT